MDAFFQHLEQFCRGHRHVALATLVHTQGTSPRKEGAKMWVGEDGELFGAVTIGGCVDAQVIEASETVLSERVPRLLELPLGDEDAWELGFSCAGTLEVFIEPLHMESSQTFQLYTILKRHVEQGSAAVLLTRLDGGMAGAKLLLLDDGTTMGSLGDPILEQNGCQIALNYLVQGISRTVPVALCGQTVRVFLDVHTPPATLIIVGAGQVAISLVQMARPAGLQTVVVDSRPRFATSARFPLADQLLVGIPSEIVQTLPLSAFTAVILVAHDYKFDLPVLRHVLSSPVPYIGVLGSRRRGEGLLKFLRDEGVTEEMLQRIRVPIGLDLGGQSIPEIALAILAEVVSARYGGSNLPLSHRLMDSGY
jgi:xanthine dehydrogenase accessory factor